MSMHLAVGITGASGYCLGHEITQALASRGHDVTLIVSDAAPQIALLEGCDVAATRALATAALGEHDLAAAVSSSTAAPDAMIIAPCSLKTLSSIAHGYGDNLITRTAETCLRMRRPLVLMPRETPLSLMAVENMRTLILAGAVMLPPVMAYYTHPRTIGDVTAFFVGKALDALGIAHDLPSWRGV